MSDQRAERGSGDQLPAAGQAAVDPGDDAGPQAPGTAGGGPDGTAGGGSEVMLPPHRLRAQAFAIDLLFVGFVFVLAFLLGNLPYLPMAGLIAVAVIAWIYYLAVTTWLMDGQTAGKLITGIRVRRLDTGTVPQTLRGTAWSVGRHTIGYVIADVFLLGALLAVVDRRRRCVHDYAFASEVILEAEQYVPSGSFAERNRLYWKRFFERHDELVKRYVWFLGPWKWLSKVVVKIAIGVAFVFNLLGWSQASPSAAPAGAAEPLTLKASVGLWAATSVATGVVVTNVAADPDPISSLNVVILRQTVGQPATAEIHLMHADGTNAQQLTSNDVWDGDPDLFADRLVAFTSERDGNLEIYFMNADGSEQTRLTSDPGEDYCPAWSPDGSRIAFTSVREGNLANFVMDADGSNLTRVGTGSFNDVCPDWSPDGDSIVFASNRDGNAELYITQVDGSEARRLTDNPGVDRDPAWSPDGTRIAFTSDRDGDENIYVVDVDGDLAAVRVTEHPAADYDPMWAPGGNAIIFESDRGLGSGGSETYVVDLDGTNLRRLTSWNECGPDTTTCILE